ncbi:hypothetical protein [Sulfuracidifex tepidarius]|uniref:Uncharacterized protein n=1 Tax=Sulfuracidifex tepidarius TaxID=1294262 RepID=A0A510E2L1_9CREN|nr:hypothetical protein [Sulfuracidifex tepidarius]BBG23554.1 hypothetical protein IC006_0838 [Sulfuracidifex tepidarius]BBG26308.1 hypothetical protein IC007_0813 [Sulfuracidifex tepidarius]
MNENSVTLSSSGTDIFMIIVSKEYFIDGEVEPSICMKDHLVFINRFPFAIRTTKGVIESIQVKCRELKQLLMSLF